MDNNGLVGAIARLGAGAVIAADWPVFAPFGKSFGEDLINELFYFKNNASVSLFNVRQKYLKRENNNNPLGLLFTLYGNPLMKIETGKPVKKIGDLLTNTSETEQ